ncbi:pilin [Massilia sp. W12]|uniref:pilin n=1 Tax=Massilia sp. W12 TaxID=3126507 RepID=UPI0030CF3377
MPTSFNNSRAGFTLIELMAVIAVIAILGAMALPSYHARILRQQVDEAMVLSEVAKQRVAVHWATKGQLPSDNESAGAPAADKIVNNFVSAVEVSNGAVTITFGNRAGGAIKGKKLTLRAAVVPDTPQVPVTWVCGKAEAPANMTVHGTDNTNVEAGFLPLICQPKSKGT